MAPRRFANLTGLGEARTLSEFVTARLRDAIVTGELRPGDYLWQDRLAEQFGVSRVPVRESLRQLAAEGLVKLQSHRSALVTELSPSEVEELFAVGGTLERLATRHGAEQLTAADVAELGELLQEMHEFADRPLDWYMLNLRFHMLMMRASDWTRLVRLVEESRRNVLRYINDAELHRQQVHTWHGQHVAIFEAVRDARLDDLERLVDEHWRYSAAAARDFLEEKSRALAGGAISGEAQ